MRTELRCIVALLMVASLAACSSLQEVNTEPDYAWQMNAKVAFRTDTESGTAKAVFTQSEDHVGLRLSGAMGLRSLSIKCSEQQCVTTDAQGTQNTVALNDGLIELLPNTFVPVYDLFLWVRGHKPKDHASFGWRVTIETDGNAPNALPTRITLEHDLGARLKIAVIDWSDAG